MPEPIDPAAAPIPAPDAVADPEAAAASGPAAASEAVAVAAAESATASESVTAAESATASESVTAAESASPAVAARIAALPPLRTLAIDIGGTGVKALVLDAKGFPVTDRVRIPTPHPPTPEAIVPAIVALVAPLGGFDRVSVGFPGVVVDGVTRSAPNLDPTWQGFDLARALTSGLGCPVRVLNDAGVQGYGVIDGHGVEMVLTLGTGLGCAVYLDGHYVPNLELAHHPFRKGRTYEDYVGAPALHRVGHKKWNRRVGRVIAQVLPVWNPRHLYLGGGNAKHLTVELPANVSITPNLAGLLGGIVLWHDARFAPVIR